MRAAHGVGDGEQPALELKSLGRFVLRRRRNRVLHMGGRVEHLDEWRVPVATYQVRRPTRQPVMGVD